MTSQSMTAFAPAKVNLALHVVGQRPDGYHLLDSVVMFADFGDQVSVTPAEHSSLIITGPLSEGIPTDPSNLCLRAAKAFGETVKITLDKHLPAGAGIGGGSSDAAAVLRALEGVFDAPFSGDPVHLGADVPVCLAAKSSRMQGIGEQVSPFVMPELCAVLVNPRIAVHTPDVFKALTKRDNPPMDLPKAPLQTSRDAISWIKSQRNDMQAAAIAIQPIIEDVLAALSATDSLCIRMSGSGATCFGLYADRQAAEQAAIALRQAHPEWWIKAVTLS